MNNTLIDNNTSDNNKNSIVVFFLLIQLILFSINLVAFIGEGERNLPVIGLLFLESIFPLLFFQKITKEDFFIIAFILSFTVSILLNYDEKNSYSSFFYCLLFVNSFFVWHLMLRSKSLQMETYQKALKILLILYFFDIILQQIQLIIRLPVGFNLNIRAVAEWHWSVNGLMTEKSHTARILFLMMYSYYTIWSLKEQDKSILSFYKGNKILFCIFSYSLLTIGSVAAILLYLLFLANFISLKNIVFIFLFLSLLTFLQKENVYVIERTTRFIPALLSFNVSTMMEADHSAAMRFVSTIIFFQSLNEYSLSLVLFGGGANYSRVFYNGLIQGLNMETWSGGMLSSFLMDYGLITSFTLIAMLLKFCYRKGHFFDFIVMATIYIASSISTQLFWITFILLSTNKFFSILQEKENTISQPSTDEPTVASSIAPGISIN